MGVYGSDANPKCLLADIDADPRSSYSKSQDQRLTETHEKNTKTNRILDIFVESLGES